MALAKHVAVVRGGPSPEYDVSLATGARVLRSLEQSGNKVRDVFIDRTGAWHVRGMPVTPERALAGVDVAFNALHGTYGEDGAVQRTFEVLGVPYTGAKPFAAALSMNKELTKEALAPHGIRTPRYSVYEVTDDLTLLTNTIFRSFMLPVIVKPVTSGSSRGVTLAKSFGELTAALKAAFQYDRRVMVEEYIRGREVTVGVIDGYRDQERYALVPVEVSLAGRNSIFDYETKFKDPRFSAPARLDGALREELIQTARAVHHALNLRHYSRSDFIVSPKGVYFLEVNSLPGLSEASSMHAGLEAVGAPFDHFIQHVISAPLL